MRMKQATNSHAVKKLDPGIVAVIEALACRAAREDHEAEIKRIERRNASKPAKNKA